MINRIIFIHEGKAHYPELQAYKLYFEGEYQVQALHKNMLSATGNYSNTVLWYLMGFYPKKIPAACIIHDYRSLSVGRLGHVKDVIKKYCNHRPNLRLYHDQETRDIMGFNDGIENRLLLLGVPEIVQQYSKVPKQYTYDFCYIGAISRERESDAMIRNFLACYGNSKNLVLIGKVDDGMDKLFEEFDNIIFTQRLPQAKVFEIVQQTYIALCYVPNHRPYCYHVPAKLLEYAAIGKKIIVNDSSGNINAMKKYSINAQIYDGFHFPDNQVISQIPDNAEFDYEALLWKNRIESSGVRQYLSEWSHTK